MTPQKATLESLRILSYSFLASQHSLSAVTLVMYLVDAT